MQANVVHRVHIYHLGKSLSSSHSQATQISFDLLNMKRNLFRCLNFFSSFSGQNVSTNCNYIVSNSNCLFIMSLHGSAAPIAAIIFNLANSQVSCPQKQPKTGLHREKWQNISGMPAKSGNNFSPLHGNNAISLKTKVFDRIQFIKYCLSLLLLLLFWFDKFIVELLRRQNIYARPDLQICGSSPGCTNRSRAL